MKEAKDALDVLKFPDEERQQYKRYVDNLRYQASMAHTYEAMRDEGRAEGRTREKKDTARKMLAKGYAAEDIAELTGLSVEDMTALAAHPEPHD